MLSRWKVTAAAFGAVSKLLELQLRGDGDEGDDDGSAQTDDGVFYHHLGLAIRPVVARTLRALGYEDGDDVAVLKVWDRASTPTDLAAGETRVYAAGAVGVVLRMLTNQIVAEAATILLGAGATKGVNRQGDSIEPGTLTVTMGVPAANTPVLGTNTVPVIFTYTPPDGAPSVGTLTFVGVGLTIAGSVNFTLGGRTGAGSSKVRAVD
jgi:hypothetical protein